MQTWNGIGQEKRQKPSFCLFTLEGSGVMLSSIVHAKDRIVRERTIAEAV